MLVTAYDFRHLTVSSPMYREALTAIHMVTRATAATVAHERDWRATIVTQGQQAVKT